jgi:hypothetical protein
VQQAVGYSKTKKLPSWAYALGMEKWSKERLPLVN